MPGLWRHRVGAMIGLLCAAACPALWPAAAAAQNASYFSPTYAASDGSPYSDVYARTFGAGGPPAAARAPSGPPLVTAAPPLENHVVYVIENGRLLTINAEDFAKGREAPLATAPLPGSAKALTAQELELPSIAGRLYGTAPLETAAGGPDSAPGAPIRLVPPQN